MIVSIMQEDLKDALAIVARSVPNRPFLNILNNVLIETTENSLRLTATDLEMFVTLTVSASVGREGKTTVPAKLFYGLVNELSPSRVDLEFDKKSETLLLQCGANKNKIKCIRYDEFPSTITLEDSEHVSIPAQELKRAIKFTAFATSPEPTRPVLTGLLLRSFGNNLVVVGVDGYRLSVYKIELPNEFQEEVNLIVPAKAMRELARVIASDDTEVALYFDSKNKAIFKVGNFEVGCLLIDGSFPQYSSVIPEEYKTVIQLHPEDLLKSVKRASLFARYNADTLYVCVDEENGDVLYVRADSAEYGSNETNIEVYTRGEPFKIALNSIYLKDVLSVVDTEHIEVYVNGSDAPFVIRMQCEEERDKFVHVIMPMRISQ